MIANQLWRMAPTLANVFIHIFFAQICPAAIGIDGVPEFAIFTCRHYLPRRVKA
jgi:hypothetical protein